MNETEKKNYPNRSKPCRNRTTYTRQSKWKSSPLRHAVTQRSILVLYIYYMCILFEAGFIREHVPYVMPRAYEYRVCRVKMRLCRAMDSVFAAASFVGFLMIVLIFFFGSIRCFFFVLGILCRGWIWFGSIVWTGSVCRFGQSVEYSCVSLDCAKIWSIVNWQWNSESVLSNIKLKRKKSYARLNIFSLLCMTWCYYTYAYVMSSFPFDKRDCWLLKISPCKCNFDTCQRVKLNWKQCWWITIAFWLKKLVIKKYIFCREKKSMETTAENALWK